MHGAWALAAQFTQPADKTMADFNATLYAELFASPSIWIEGHAQGPPVAPLSSAPDFVVRSLAWDSLMAPSGSYRLRQQFFRGSMMTSHFDASYAFTFNGQVTQRAETPVPLRFWTLSDRVVHADTTLVTWDTPPADVSLDECESPSLFFL